MPQISETAGVQPNPWTKLVLELGPLALFFLAYSRYGIFPATGALMAATALSLGLSYALYRSVPIMPLVSGAVVLVFGGLTLILQNDVFIKMKPTIVNTLFASVLLGGLAFGKPLLGLVLGTALRMTDEGWRVFTLRWGLFFVFLAILNEIVWRNFSEETWVNFKVFGIMPLTMVFALAQAPLLGRYALPEESGKDGV